MAKINFQFHATREEISTYICDKVKENKLIVVILQTIPAFEYIVIDRFSISKDIICNADLVLLYMDQPIEKASNYIEFLKKNKDYLCIRLGKQDDKILKESVISGTAEHEILKLWRNLINQYKKTMHKGVWVVGGYKDVKKYYKDHRYTQKAKEMYENGIIIMGVAGNNTFMLSPLEGCE